MLLRQVPRKLLRGVSIGLTTVAFGGSAYFLYRNDFDVSSIGAMRLARAGIAATKIIVDYKWTLRKLDPETEEYKTIKSMVHKRSAELLLQLACANGGVYIKVGQHCGSLEYLLPEEYTTTLSVLHSKAPETSLEDVQKVLRHDMGVEVSDIFSSFDARPHGAASLAQVYKATLKSTGETVAVKVQHPRVKPHSVVDMATMEALVRIVAKIFPDFNLMWLVEETKKNLPRELDFLSEAKNAERVRRMFQHLEFLRVPKIHWEHCTDRVLVMEYCEGGQVNDLEYFRENRIDAHDVCRKLGKLYSEMIFVQGYVHCDPHPGNVLVNKKPNGSVELVLLDHGLYITLTDDFRLNYANLWLALLKPDQDAIKYWSKKMGVGDLYGLFACMVTARSWKSVTSGISKNVITADEACEIKRYAGSLLPQISDVLERMPRQMLLILKTNDLLRGIEYRLKTHNRADTFVQMARCCVRAVHEHAIRSTDVLWRQITLRVSMWFSLSKIYLYERYLIVSELCSSPFASS